VFRLKRFTRSETNFGEQRACYVAVVIGDREYMESLALYTFSLGFILLAITKSAVILTVLLLIVTRTIVKVNTSLIRAFFISLAVASLYYATTLILALSLGKVLNVVLAAILMFSLFVMIGGVIYGKYAKVNNVSIGYVKGLKISIISIIVSLYYAGTLYMGMQMLGKMGS
jgi:hypothetical protein